MRQVRRVALPPDLRRRMKAELAPLAVVRANDTRKAHVRRDEAIRDAKKECSKALAAAESDYRERRAHVRAKYEQLAEERLEEAATAAAA